MSGAERVLRLGEPFEGSGGEVANGAVDEPTLGRCQSGSVNVGLPMRPGGILMYK
jgi:hypothetical protein